ncbi:hypothetical protein JTE90_026583 [Oedothorax gibbosus]|uniref:UDENN FNIP1/2-type domain-containing protein n=1 Tax=Oedothorax gibbosus TaxID=931172 RepID=A0AAV6TYF3_9ARAC|nr:hypothetical protein JTE90_026583 [Oedothorax gibbosus]
MHIGMVDIWKRILEGLGLIPPENSRYILKEQEQRESNRVPTPVFDSSQQVRILLFRELNGQERRLLFDSKAVRKRGEPAPGRPPRPPRTHDSSIEKSFKLGENSHNREYIYEWQKSSSDETLLREMIFGAVSISFHGTTLKVHTIRSPPQIMLSVVFPAPPAPSVSREPETEESGTWTNSIEVTITNSSEKTDSHLAHSVPVNVPSRLSDQYADCMDSDSDSLQSMDGHSSLPSTRRLSPESSSKGGLPRSSSYNSLQRRILRNKATSIELGMPKAEESPSYDYSSTPGQKKSKLGLSIVINLSEDENKQENRHFTDFLFTHISLIEGHLMSLKDTVIRAYLNRKNFVHLMFEGSKKFQSALSDLYTAPRLQNPEWLTIISSPNHRHLSYVFLQKFSDLLRKYDKKETNFFVSTLLTAVLTHHLAWVPSIIPTDSKIHSTQSSHKHTPHWVDLLAKSRPYNPLWVQLSDLYGALGIPAKLTKTVVRGEKADVVLKFLQVLSYFIRCSDICQQIYDRSDQQLPHTSDISTGSPTNTEPKAPDSCSSTPTSSLSCSLTPQAKPSLPQILKLPLVRSDQTSDSSREICDLILTPVDDERNLIPSPQNEITNTKELEENTCSKELENSNNELENVSSKELDNTRNSKEYDSLGYASLEEKVEAVMAPKRSVLGECPTNCCREKLRPCVQAMKVGKENDPEMMLHSSRVRDGRDCMCSENKTCGLEFSKKGSVNEYESVEDGYHSMEEPHSPSKGHLGEMLKRMESWCPEGCEEKTLPKLKHVGEKSDVSSYKSFGWSLMAGVSERYLRDFCLQGVTGHIKEEDIREDLLRSMHTHVLGEPVSESICLVADTDKWNVQLLSSHSIIGDRSDATIAMSSLVSGICEAIVNMVDLGIPPESCIIYLEDRLQELYTRSQALADFMRGGKTPLSKIVASLGVDLSDLPLLLSIATTHSPHLSAFAR